MKFKKGDVLLVYEYKVGVQFKEEWNRSIVFEKQLGNKPESAIIGIWCDIKEGAIVDLESIEKKLSKKKAELFMQRMVEEGI